jgi:hypothetical protein
MSGCSGLVSLEFVLMGALVTDDTEFPERPMALGNFLKGLRKDLSITMFHYRNHGAGKSV